MPVVEGFFNGVAASPDRHMERIRHMARITSGDGSLWTENVGEMVAHGIDPPILWVAAP